MHGSWRQSIILVYFLFFKANQNVKVYLDLKMLDTNTMTSFWKTQLTKLSKNF
jgi:hypothetical protein